MRSRSLFRASIASVALIALIAISGQPRPARACSFSGPQPFAIDPAMVGTDVQPPTLTGLSVVKLQRGKAPQQQGCGTSASSCDGFGSFTLAKQGTDDLTPADRIGYRLSIASGSPPQGFTLPAQAVTGIVFDDQIWLNWDDGATDDQESFDFTLSVVAIDLAGNESAPQTVRIADERGGCSVAARPASHLASTTPSAGLALVVLFSRRRRRADSRRG